MATVIPAFNTRRMVFDYLRGVYQPAARNYLKLASREFAGARLLAEWKQRVVQVWPRVTLRVLSEAARDVQVHIWPSGGDEQRSQLLFRDWLRHDAEDRSRYEAVKRELASRSWDDSNDYAIAKTGATTNEFHFAGAL